MTKIIIYTLFIILMASCFGVTNCPKYPESKLSWLPYNLDNKIKFSNNHDTINFIVTETWISEESSFKNNCKCECVANALFKTDINNKTDIKIEGYSNYYGDRTNYEYNLIKYGGDHYSAQHRDNFYFNDENIGIENETISEYTIGSKTYSNVLELELDTVDDNSLNWRKPEIWRLIIADSIGIVQFDDCKSKTTWIRID